MMRALPTECVPAFFSNLYEVTLKVQRVIVLQIMIRNYSLCKHYCDAKTINLDLNQYKNYNNCTCMYKSQFYNTHKHTKHNKIY